MVAWALHVVVIMAMLVSSSRASGFVAAPGASVGGDQRDGQVASTGLVMPLVSANGESVNNTAKAASSALVMPLVTANVIPAPRVVETRQSRNQQRSPSGRQGTAASKPAKVKPSAPNTTRYLIAYGLAYDL